MKAQIIDESFWGNGRPITTIDKKVIALNIDPFKYYSCRPSSEKPFEWVEIEIEGHWTIWWRPYIKFLSTVEKK